MCNLTQQEKELVTRILTTAPLSGNVQSLPPILEQILVIVEKINNEAPPITDESADNNQ